MRIDGYRACRVMAALLAIGAPFTFGALVASEAKSKPLPPPATAGKMSLEEAIRQRRSVRQFADKPLTIEQIGQLCWAGQGITDRERGLRTAPSAGAMYPIELYVVTAEGVDHYLPKEHALERHASGDLRGAMQGGGGRQGTIASAPASLVIVAVPERLAAKYKDRAERYSLLETGHVAQNILLQATALHLAGVPVGGVDEEKLAQVLKLPKGHRVFYVLPIGHPRG